MAWRPFSVTSPPVIRPEGYFRSIVITWVSPVIRVAPTETFGGNGTVGHGRTGPFRDCLIRAP